MSTGMAYGTTSSELVLWESDNLSSNCLAFLKKRIDAIFWIVLIIAIYLIYTSVDTQNFDTGGKNTLVFYSMPGCRHCINFKDTWKALLKKPPSGVAMKEIDKNPPEDVVSFPTIMLYRADGSRVKFDMPRTEPIIRKWVGAQLKK